MKYYIQLEMKLRKSKKAHCLKISSQSELSFYDFNGNLIFSPFGPLENKSPEFRINQKRADKNDLRGFSAERWFVEEIST